MTESDINFPKFYRKFLFYIIMLHFPFLSFCRGNNFVLIKEEASYYEFNTDRDKIYILDSDGKLHVFDTASNEMKQLIKDENIKGDTYLIPGRDNPLFFSRRGILYITGEHFVYKITDGELQRIPFLYEEYRAGAVNTETIKADQIKIKKLNKILGSMSLKSVSMLFDTIYILEKTDGLSAALYQKTLKKIDEGNRNKILKFFDKDNISRKNDQSYFRENSGRSVTLNYFENRNIVIREKSYFCQIFRNIMSLIPGSCRYKIKVIAGKKITTLKDPIARHRKLYKGGQGKDLWWNGDLYKRLPDSKYISDKYGNIYLLFFFNEKVNLIKIPL